MVSIDSTNSQFQYKPLSEADRQNAIAILNASDSTLSAISHNNAISDFNNAPSRQREKAFAHFLPVADSLIKGATTAGSLSTKTKAGLDTAKDWGVFYAVTAAYNKIVKTVLNVCPPLQKFSEDHPAAASISNAVVGTAVGIAGINLVNKVLNKHVRPRLANIDSKFTQIVDKSKVGATANNIVSNTVSKFPKAAAVASSLAKIAIPVACVVVLAKSLIDLASINKHEKQNFEDLKQTQLNIARSIVNQ